MKQDISNMIFRWVRLSFCSIISTFFVFFSATTLAQNTADYALAPGDAIRIQVFQNPDLTVDTRVSESGTITFPLIGTVEVGGLSSSAAEKRIAGKLEGGGFLRKPQVTISIAQVRGSQVSVLGQVNRPGRFPIESANMRLSDLLALAGGVMPSGDDIVVVTGQRDGAYFQREIDIPAMYANQRPEDDILVRGGDTVYVNRARMFYIYGEAQRPGPYRLERGLTVMQALAIGGGPTARGSDTRLKLRRKNQAGVLEETTPAPDDLVQANDVIFVRESIF